MFSLAAEATDLKPIGAMGKGEKVLGGGREAVLFEHQGKGCLSHFWFGGNFDGVENTRIRFYVDGEKEPSIDMGLYLGHGIGFNDNTAPWATKHIGRIGKRNWYGKDTSRRRSHADIQSSSRWSLLDGHHHVAE